MHIRPNPLNSQSTTSSNGKLIVSESDIRDYKFSFSVAENFKKATKVCEEIGFDLVYEYFNSTINTYMI